MSVELKAGDRLTTGEYLSSYETNRRFELAWGMVREPAAPHWDHQCVVGRLYERLNAHARRFRIGQVGLSPIDVVLDRGRHLVVQPDIVFVAANRCDIIRDRIWGAPDLVLEVASRDSRQYDRNMKRMWYAQYGVREIWLVDPRAGTIAVANPGTAPDTLAVFAGRDMVRSRVLPRLRLRVASAFGW